ncbi:MAG: hypothetical protein ACXVB1_00135 [Pseudobdellovibrionaceae bacterium]
MTIQNLITEEMEKQKLSAHALARKAGLDGGNTWRFVHGNSHHKMTSMKTVLKLMRALQIDMQRLAEVEL